MSVFKCMVLLYVTSTTILCLVNTERPLYITPYLDKGDVDIARNLSLVTDTIHDPFPESHAGFITVDKTLGNHLFFWFFPHPDGNNSTPLLIWLNGGPTISSMVGLLWENGPIEIIGSDHVTYRNRKFSWTDHFSMLYIDNPVGTGFSYTEKGPAGYRVTEDGYTKDLFSFVEQFYMLFPEYLERDLYIGGQSYAGKYVPALAHRIHRAIQEDNSNIPLTGIYIGGCYFDPFSQGMAYFDYVYAIGAISFSQKLECQENVTQLFERYKTGQLPVDISADDVNAILLPDHGLSSLDNYVTGEHPNYEGVYEVMNSEKIRKAVHVGNLPYSTWNRDVSNKYGIDTLVSVKPKLAELMNNYKVLLYSGDYDVIVSGPTVEAALMTTEWDFQDEYNNSSRKMWRMDNQTILGFWSFVGQFCRVTIHGAGHESPYDQPETTLNMMLDFVYHGCIQEEEY